VVIHQHADELLQQAECVQGFGSAFGMREVDRPSAVRSSAVLSTCSQCRSPSTRTPVQVGSGHSDGALWTGSAYPDFFIIGDPPYQLLRGDRLHRRYKTLMFRQIGSW